ncbi:MAG: polysaccharide deacetylase family protein [Bacteroidota bacterium]
MGVTKKLVMIHADDAGLSHSQNSATIACLEKGTVTSYSIMVPCNAFEEIALFAIQNPKFDYGIHLTLTCEWHQHRFGPVLPVAKVPSLVDENGYFYKSREILRTKGKPEEAYQELKAQLEKAYDFGLKPSHIDSHMYSVAVSDNFFKMYIRLGKAFGLPVFANQRLMKMAGLDPGNAIDNTLFFVDYAHLASFEDFKKGHLRSFYHKILTELANGLHVLLVHPAFDDEEMKQITINHPNFGSEWRQMDYETFTDPETRSKIKENDIELISWREIKERFSV